jgi:hypothetical protein
MDSRAVSQICKGISKWHPFNKETVKDAPVQHGIYIFRIAQSKRFGRLKGESDILYIGSTKCNRGLRGRLEQYFTPAHSQLTNIRIHAMAKKYDMEVAWYPYTEAGNLEHQLLRRYIGDHDELPPLNHADRRLLEKDLTETAVFGDKRILEVFDRKDGNLISRTEG